MKKDKIRVGITQGDINGVGLEVILKSFVDPLMLDLCTPVIYGSPKVAAYHRKLMDIQTNFSIINSAEESQDGRVNLVSCMDDDVKVDFAKPDSDAGRYAVKALEMAVEEYKRGLIDVIVTAPFNKQTIQIGEFNFTGHTDYLEKELGNGSKSLTIMVKEDFRFALVTGHVPFTKIASSITQELIEEKLSIFNQSLRDDFGIDSPRIAVLSLNPHNGIDGQLGDEEITVIRPAIRKMISQDVLCYGPFSADGLMGSGNFIHFDGILAMYHDQGMAPFKAVAGQSGVNFTAGLPVVRTAPGHGVGYDIAGKGIADEDSFRQAIYLAIDIYRNRVREKEAHENPLRRQYYEKKDDSDKLKLDSTEEEI